MTNQYYEISKLRSKDNLPFDLLLLADDTKEAIEKYIYDSDVYIIAGKEPSHTIAIFALYRISDTIIEIKNIAVSKEFQSKGIGAYLIEQIRKIADADGYKNIIVGTDDHGVRQINFYERNGFVAYDIKKDFFINNYAIPIIENGRRLRDMVMLKMEL